ncbi:CBM35 domain-containing protein [Streptomyces rubiginosohelvolus]|uniref:CBM35 domain-containing protein n=1 Tax=Streptomyces rubiginosohelvolus TaxID=67362 RepID=UPI0036D950E7
MSRASRGAGRVTAARPALAAILAGGLLATALSGTGQAGDAGDRKAAHAAAAAPEVITVDTGRQSGPLKKAGLGTLFGVTTTPATPAALAAGSQLLLSQHQSMDGDVSYPSSTESVAAKLRGTGVKMVGRYNDLMGGWPYVWKGYDDWMRKVDSATRSIQKYKDVLDSVAPLNEPDNKLGPHADSPFMTDPRVQGATYDAKVNWLWTETVRRIRTIDRDVRIMGPNYEHYNPWEAPDRQPRMRNFLVNAKNTGTLPDIIGWHSLGPSPGDVPETLTRYYRPLEQELGISPRPVMIEEYGPGNGEFEGVPGTMIKHWAEFARYGIDSAAMGIYTNPGLLGNTLRRTSEGLKPNGGWHFMNWFKEMRGNQLFVSRWDTRHYQASDGVASWDPAARTVTVLAGGDDGDIDVRLLGLAARGLGPQVRVRVEYTHWSTDPLATDSRADRAGDPQTGAYNVYDKVLGLDQGGNLTVPIRKMERLNGYRITVQPAALPAAYPSKYEAEDGRQFNTVPHTGSDTALASGRGYIGGIDRADSSVAFTVRAERAGIHLMTVRYANGTAAEASHGVRVGSGPQGSVTYPPTGGWANTTMGTAVKRIVLAAGANTVTLAKGAGHAELDYIDVRPDTHRYEAELAAVSDASIRHYEWNEFPDYVGGIDKPTSSVEFAVDAPRAGTYLADVGYANGLAGSADHRVSVNDTATGTITYPSTGAWLSGPRQDAVAGTATLRVVLREGVNRVRLTKGQGYAEVDWLSLRPDTAVTAE